MRLIYTDEAGTSANEPVRVVASVVVHGDNEYRHLVSEIVRIVKERVPAEYQSGFIFHAKDIFNGGKKIDRSKWRFDERLDFFKEFVGIPFVNNIPISCGIVFKGSYDDLDFGNTFSNDTFEHMMAFSQCIERADCFLRKYLNGQEIGTIVAEDVTHIRSWLSKAALIHRDQPLTIAADCFRAERWQQILDRAPEEVTYEIKHIVDVPHFVSKDGAPLLQLADACAFAFRRCLAKQGHGNDLLLAMLGPAQGEQLIRDDVWFSLTSSGLFNTQKYWSAEQRAEIQNVDFVLRVVQAFANLRHT